MALTYSYAGADQLKGPYQGGTPYHLFRFAFSITGTYATGGNQIDLCQFFTPASGAGGSRMGVTAIAVKWAKAFGDYSDGTTTCGVNDAQVSLADGGSTTPISSASTGNLATLKLYTGANGSGGSEVTNATALTGSFAIVAAVQLTYGALGTV
jgi:hypothetical protein